MNANVTGRMPPSLSPSTLALLAHERILVAQPEMVRARILARARALPRESLAATLPGGAPTRLRRLLFAAAAGIALTAGVAAAFQLASFQLIDRPAPTPPANPGTSSATRLPPTEPPAASMGLVPTLSKEADPAATATSATAASARAAGPSRRTMLAGKHEGGPEELQLLSRARQSDAQGDYAEVLAVVADHERSYPAGRLSEEREVLRVKALVGLGRASESRQAAAKFRRQFPRSVLLQKIEDLLASLP